MLCRRDPQCRYFVLEHAFPGGQSTIAQAGLEDRCEVVSGDFFVSVPAGADAHLLRNLTPEPNSYAIGNSSLVCFTGFVHPSIWF
jgi:hypothetical protein